MLNNYDLGHRHPAGTSVQANAVNVDERKPWNKLLAGLEDNALIDCYYSAVEMKLEEDFIELLRREILQRGIDINSRAASVQFVQKV